MDCDGTVTKSSGDSRGSSGAGVAFQNCHELRPRAAPRGGVRVLGEGDSYRGTQLRTKHVALFTGGRVSTFRRRVEGVWAGHRSIHCSYQMSKALHFLVLTVPKSNNTFYQYLQTPTLCLLFPLCAMPSPHSELFDE